MKPVSCNRPLGDRQHRTTTTISFRTDQIKQSSTEIVSNGGSQPSGLDKENTSRQLRKFQSEKLLHNQDNNTNQQQLTQSLSGKASSSRFQSPELDKENITRSSYKVNGSTRKPSRLTTLRRTLGGKAQHSATGINQDFVNVSQEEEPCIPPVASATSFTTKRMNKKLAPLAFPPKTPKSMLKFELDASGSAIDESLLVSPIIGNISSRCLNVDLCSPLHEARDPRHADDVPTPTIESLESFALGMSHEIAVLDACLQSAGSTSKPSSNRPLDTRLDEVLPITTNVSTNENGDGTLFRSPMAYLLERNEVVRVSSQQTPCIGPGVSKSQCDGEDASHLDIPKVMEHRPCSEATNPIARAPSPISTRGNGVQMDLSALFRDVTLSPTKSATETETVPTVSIGNPRQDLWLDFGRSNTVERIRTMSFYLEAPADGSENCVVRIEKVPIKKGFGMNVCDAHDQTVVHFTRGERKRFHVSWKPIEAGGVREVIMLKLPRGRLQVVCHGHAQPAPPLKKSKSASGPTRVVGKTNNDALNQTKLRSSPIVEPRIHKNKELPKITTSSPAISHSSASPMIDKTVFDEANADRQCIAFSEWLNYTFQPTEDQELQGHETEQLQYPENRLALKTLLLHRFAAQARSKAADVFRSREMLSIKAALESEVSRGRLSIRSDRDMYADLNLRSDVTELLLSYSTPWLRLGLETIFNKPISAEIPTFLSPHRDASRIKCRGKAPLGRMKMILKEFIINNVISDNKVLAKYTKGRCKVPSGRFEKDYHAEIRSVVLNRLLLLIFFLDRAREANILSKIPCLFTRESKIKSSREVLVAFCRGFLSSEGDINKHFGRIGLKVNYKQDPIDELDFTVTNLAVEFRDGIRLAKLTEILTAAPPKSLLTQLRLPSVSRLQKLHNNELVLTVLRAAGVPALDSILPHHIVDGYRDKFLLLLWSMAAHFSLAQLIQSGKLEEEIKAIRRARCMRTKAWIVSPLSSGSTDGKPPTNQGIDAEQYARTLLLLWCQEICSCFGHTVDNFSSSFADGKALCLLLHYYHPTALRIEEILPTTTDMSAAVPGINYEEAILNERKNSRLANSVMMDLGGIPKILAITDTLNAPDEKSMLLCLTYLCSRLMESSKEIFSSMLIQTFYRKYLGRVELARKAKAAAFLLNQWRTSKHNYYAAQRQRYLVPVRVIERFVVEKWPVLMKIRRSRLARQQLEDAAIKVQKLSRRFIARLHFVPSLEQHRSAVMLQAHWRANTAKCYFWASRCAAVALQRWCRAFVKRRRLSAVNASVSAIQAVVRGWRVRRAFDRYYHSAVKIQCLWRSFSAQIQFRMDMLDIVAVQCQARRKLAILQRNRILSSVIAIQKLGRRYLAKCRVGRIKARIREVKSITNSAIRIQCFWRSRLAQLWFVNHVAAAVMIQCFFRRKLAVDLLARLRKNVLTLQYAARRYIALLRLQRRLVEVFRQRSMNLAATKIQCVWRGFVTRIRYLVELSCIVMIQTLARRNAALNLRNSTIRATVTLQKFARRWAAYRFVKQLRAHAAAKLLRNASSLQIQSLWRMYKARFRLSRAVSAATNIQALLRGCRTRRQNLRANSCARVLQQRWRMYAAIKSFSKSLAAVVTIQSIMRRSLASREAIIRRNNILLLQTNFRCWVAKARVAELRLRKAQKEFDRWKMLELRATQIQAWSRGHQIRRELKTLQTSAVVLQQYFRGFISRTKYHMDVFHIIITQSVVRKWIAWHSFKKLQLATVRVQVVVRCWLARRMLACLLSEKLKTHVEFLSATIVQSLVRGMLARSSFRLHVAALLIQKTWRCYTVHLDFAVALLSIIKIQACVRRYLAIRTAAKMASEILWRSARIIQCTYRGFIERINYFEKQWATLEIQRWVRGHLVRLGLGVKHCAAVDIQRVFRGYLANLDYIIAIRAAIHAQCLVRRWLARRYVNARRWERLCEIVRCMFERKMATKIQRCYRQLLWRRRQYFAIVAIQTVVRKFLHNVKCEKILRGILRLQCHVRGKAVRRHSSLRVQAVAKRVRIENARAIANPGRQIGARTLSALAVLQKSTRLTDVMSAVTTLETCTQLSKACCLCFVQADAPKVLFTLIQTCNRSLPHIELLHYILLSLNNVAKYDDLLSNVTSPESADILIDLIQFHRDQEKVVDLASSLLYAGVRSSRQFRHRCDTDKNLKRLKVSYTLCIRKARSLAVSRRSSAVASHKKWNQSVKLLWDAISLLEPGFEVDPKEAICYSKIRT